MIRAWQKELGRPEIQWHLENDAAAPDSPPESHERLESDFEIVEPPEGADMHVNHGGDDVCQDVENAPARKDAHGEPTQPPEPADWEATLAVNLDLEPTPSEAPENEDPGTKNRARDRHTKAAFLLEALLTRRLALALATIVSKVAEDLAGWPTQDGDDEWDVDAIMRRHLDRRPLYKCRQSRERERLVLVLDTSGSCADQARLFAEIAEAAMRMTGDLEIYEAPNAGLVAKSAGKEREEFPEPIYRWPFAGRTIIFFGDFDGGDSVIEASFRNRVYWFSCESRYTDTCEHSWCSRELGEFKGFYYPCYNKEDFIALARKLRA